MNKERILSVDALKGLAIIAVLLLHSLDSEILDFIKSVIHIGQAVPVFALITFYLTFLSLEKNGGRIRGYYSVERLKRMSKRILLPFIVVTFVQCLMLVCVSRFHPLEILIEGGYGPGSYYVWIYLQIWLLAPLIFWLLKKNDVVGSIVVYVACIALNVLCSYCCNNDAWRLLVVRYLSLSVIAWIWLRYSSYTKANKLYLVLLGLLSLSYLLYFERFDVSPFVYYGSWRSQNYPVYFWTFVLVILCVKLIAVIPRRLCNILVWLGVNSWEVFLAQMFFIGCLSLNRFPRIYSFGVTQISYIIFVFAASIGSVMIYNRLRSYLTRNLRINH